ncbi:hypothetical protein ACJRO7_024428 [Eucalyptus globulus]|uniref:Uncharacterized protein n=1 Tax=Eucalyptus globulus TaxID=34317 RepID=A0ABD3K9L0_EUCGL
MEKCERYGDAIGRKVWCTMEEAETKTATEGREARCRAKRGEVIPRKRKLVKRMMWDRFVNCKTMVGVAEVLPLPGKH